MDFPAFFRAATGGFEPYDYQCRLACGDSTPAVPRDVRIGRGIPCESRLIAVPTGLGKTAAVVLAWLWNRLVPRPPSDQPWPRRLVYCLPMRVLVEQTTDATARWLTNLWRARENLGLTAEAADELRWLAGDGTPDHPPHSPVLLMGGEGLDLARAAWDVHPEQSALLIGTQDMLLSRALNRGYGMSRYRWPLHFGLLSNDCLWIHDETQLMGVGLETSAQLAGFRERFGLLKATRHWWMSATPDPLRLATPEAAAAPARLALDATDLDTPGVRQRLDAAKRLAKAAIQPDADAEEYARQLARETLRLHVPGSLTLLLVNTVERAHRIFRAIRNQTPDSAVTLLHSRFRPIERRRALQLLLDSTGDRIVVSTQVIEAGVDLSARTLITELAPWSSLVQRFGRVHRHGEMPESGADVRWVDVAAENSGPYRPEELAAARGLLESLPDVAPLRLGEVAPPVLPEPPRHVIRPKDLRELFDTTPDIAGADFDISRFIRDTADRDASVFWRARPADNDSSGPAPDELCPVPVGELEEFARRSAKDHIRTWEALSRAWVPATRFAPGREYRIDAEAGGYDPRVGFDRSLRNPVAEVPGERHPDEAHDEDRGAGGTTPESLAQHTGRVVTRVESLAADLGLTAELRRILGTAATFHDAGKGHEVFRRALLSVNPELSPDTLWAKSGVRAPLRFSRPRFRHELASALAFLAHHPASEPGHALIAFLIAAHHGKVRLSLRALPDEEPPEGDPGDGLFARGIHDGDVLRAFSIGGRDWPDTRLDLSLMRLGRSETGAPSWLEMSLALLDDVDLGPFRLAFLEALLRAADQRASAGSASVNEDPAPVTKPPAP